MKDEQWQVVWELFETGIKIEPGRRRSFLESASADGAVVEQALALLEGLPAGAESHLADRREGDSWPQLGRTIGRYVVTAPLARGGMGEVYCGHDTVLGRRVALKFLISPPGSDRSNSVSDQTRLIREAQAASALDHPNIVTVHEVIQAEDTLAIVTELVQGRSLRELCGAPLPLAQVIDIGTQMAKALAAAHGHGIVHRDVKPENAMLRSDGYVKVLDFGLARQVAGNITSTEGLPAGTLRYMSPEQTRAESVSAATDVFSLGIVVYELATGEHPFEAGSLLGTTHRIAYDEPALPSKLNAQVTPTLDCLIMAMLAKQPSKRPSAEEVESRLTGMIETGREGMSRRVKAWLWVSSLVAGVVVGLLLWGIATKIFAPKDLRFEQITMQAGENRVTAAALSPNGEELAFGTLGGPTYLRRMSEDGFTRPLSTPPKLQVDRLAWFADGSRLLASGTIDLRAGVWVIPLDGGAPSLIGPEGRDGVPSPDGTRIALTSADGTAIWVIGVKGEGLRQIRGSRGTSWFSALLWSPNGKRLSYERQEYAPPNNPGSVPEQLSQDYAYTYETTDVNTGRVVTSLKNVLMTSGYGLKDGRVLFVRWTFVRQWVASQLCEMRTDLKTGEVLGPIHQLPQSPDSVLGLSSISAAYDGSKIAVVGSSEPQKPNIYIADLPPGKEVSKLLNIRRLTFMHAEDYPHAWTLDSDAVIFESTRDGPFALFRQKIDGQEPERLVLSDANNVLAQVSPDGKWVLYREDREKGTKTRFMRVPMKGGTPEPLPGTENVVDFRCGQQPGSRCVLRSTENDQFVFYELDPLRGRGRELARTAWSPTELADWDISPDGRFVALPNHDPQTAIIRLISLDATRSDTAERVVTISGMKNLNGLYWATNGEGWYAVEKTPLGLVMFYVDTDGAHSWELLRSALVLWAVPSPDGRKIAFPQDTPWNNVYLVKGFR
jgi:Tol biopolymer transport system component